MHKTWNYRSVKWLANEYSQSLEQSFNFIHHKVRSLSKKKKKIQELLQIVKTGKPNISAITESKFNSNYLGRASLIDYSMVHCDSISN